MDSLGCTSSAFIKNLQTSFIVILFWFKYDSKWVFFLFSDLNHYVIKQLKYFSYSKWHQIHKKLCINYK